MVFNVSYFYGQERFGDALLFFRKHLIAVSLGAVVGSVASRVPSQAYRRLTYLVLLTALIGLVLVLVPGLGARHGGAQRWLELGPMSLQPSELAKFAVMLYLAHSLVKHRTRLASVKFGLLPHGVVVGAVAVLIALESDFGTTMLTAALAAVMLFVGGVPVRYLVATGLTVLPLLVWAASAKGYPLERLFAFLHPDHDPLGVNFQLRQSYIALGSGGLWGVGLGESRQKMFYLPEAHTDFILSVIGEELGLLGVLVVLALFAVVAARGFRIAVRHPDPFASLLAFGVTLSLTLQALVNVGVVLGCLPTKGLALPFLSYGGSAIMVALGQTGVLLALARETG
jgi:cell division protein FtsW